MKILLTGASGMLGKNILQDSRFSNYDWLTPTRSEVDLFDFKAVLSYIQKKQPDFIIHSAGRVGGIQANLAHPVDFLIENLDISRNVILAAYKSKVKKLLNLGTSCMYPRYAQNPLHEDIILKGELEPTNEAYALAKIAAQRLCSYIQKEDSSFQYKTLVPSNLYGVHDKFDPAHSHLVAAIIRKVHEAKVAGQQSVEIWGDGEARREFVFCADLADCVFKALDLKNFEKMPDVMNVGLGHDYSVNEYYQACAKVIGYTGLFKHDLTKPVGMKQKLVSTELAQAWGWKCDTTLESGLKQTYQYFLNTYS